MAKRTDTDDAKMGAGKKDKGLRYELVGVVALAVGIYAGVSLAGFSTGKVGALAAKVLTYGFGTIGAYGLPLLLLAVGSAYIARRQSLLFTARFWALLAAYVLALAIFHHFRVPEGAEILPDSLMTGGGFTGGMLLFLLRKFFGIHGTLVVLVGSSLCSLLVVTTWSLHSAVSTAKQKAQEGISVAYQTVERAGRFYNQEKDRRWSPCSSEAKAAAEEAAAARHAADLSLPDIPVFVAVKADPEPGAWAEKPEKRAKSPAASEKAVEALPLVIADGGKTGGYVLPPLTLLNKPAKQADGKRLQEMTNNARILEETFQSFNVKVKISNISQGPAVTRYELEPAPGTKVSKIVNLSDDIALSLAASGVRIEAPIPGKAAVGIEVPNKVVLSVPLREVLESSEYQKAASKLVVVLGKDIAGQTITADLGKMPHLLVAGSTGSGKSVCINTIITSILFKATPDEVKFILIDPKFVELTNYNGLPHLLTPVVTEPKQAASSLRWAVQEMDKRYSLFANSGVRDIGRYNELIEKYPVGDGSSGTKLPFIIIVIDELADLMMVSPVDVEDAIIRLAQKARACGIHMVLATQRPSVDVITGLIKANVPSRIAFAVSSQVDSRTILDMAGAEKLLGRGDMLFFPIGASKPLRVQGAFIADSEVEHLTDYIKKQAEQPAYVEGVTTMEASTKEDGNQGTFEDELLEEAVRMIFETGQASTSMLQRKFRVGYTRAARIIDTLEEMKIVGPNIGSKPRDILMTYEQVCTRYFNSRAEE